MNIVETIKKEFNYSSDLIIKEINNTYILYLESICDSDKINQFIIKGISYKKSLILKNKITGPNTILINNTKDIANYLLNGFTIVISHKIYAVETKANIIRSVEKPDSEPSIYGPKDSFNENIQTSLGLIKRRIKTKNLVNEDYFIGKITKTKISVLYLKDLVDTTMLENIKNRIKQINVDSILDIGNLKQLMSKETRSVLPTILETERPDVACNAILEGKIVIICDNSPFVIIMPAYFSDFINPVVDQYFKNLNVNFLKVLRFFCLIFTIMAPALYISLINYNHEAIPLSLLTNFAMQRNNVPFPSAFEAIFMLIICSILRESDLRFPSSYGSAVSIVGALILGEAAVSAGIISPIMIIICAFTFITSMVFTNQELVNGIRYFRFLFLILASLLGFYGFSLALLFFLIHLTGMNVLGESYSYPLAPFNKTYFQKILLQAKNINILKNRNKESGK